MSKERDNYNRLLNNIQEIQFVALELQLYLDTHPEDDEALEDFNCAVDVFYKLLAEFEECYGPLLNTGLMPANRWSQWISNPWPWQK